MFMRARAAQGTSSTTLAGGQSQLTWDFTPRLSTSTTNFLPTFSAEAVTVRSLSTRVPVAFSMAQSPPRR